MHVNDFRNVPEERSGTLSLSEDSPSLYAQAMIEQRQVSETKGRTDESETSSGICGVVKTPLCHGMGLRPLLRNCHRAQAHWVESFCLIASRVNEPPLLLSSEALTVRADVLEACIQPVKFN